jgi:hypothetical protein
MNQWVGDMAHLTQSKTRNDSQGFDFIGFYFWHGLCVYCKATTER